MNSSSTADTSIPAYQAAVRGMLGELFGLEAERAGRLAREACALLSPETVLQAEPWLTAAEAAAVPLAERAGRWAAQRARAREIWAEALRAEWARLRAGVVSAAEALASAAAIAVPCSAAVYPKKSDDYARLAAALCGEAAPARGADASEGGCARGADAAEEARARGLRGVGAPAGGARGHAEGTQDGREGLSCGPERSVWLGDGFRLRCGSVAELHNIIAWPRCGHELDVVVTYPTLLYRVLRKDGAWVELASPAELPAAEEVAEVHEPWFVGAFTFPAKALEGMQALVAECGGMAGSSETLADGRARLACELPGRAMLVDFEGWLWAVTAGCTREGRIEYRASDLVQLTASIDTVADPVLAALGPRATSWQWGQRWCTWLSGILDTPAVLARRAHRPRVPFDEIVRQWPNEYMIFGLRQGETLEQAAHDNGATWLTVRDEPRAGPQDGMAGQLECGCTEAEFLAMRCPVCGGGLTLHVSPLDGFALSCLVGQNHGGHLRLGGRAQRPQVWWKRHLGGGWIGEFWKRFDVRWCRANRLNPP